MLNEELQSSKMAIEEGRAAHQKQQREDNKLKQQYHRKINKQVKKSVQDANIEIEFTTGPIGLHLQPRKGGGVLVSEVEPGCPAVDLLKKGYQLIGFKKKKLVPSLKKKGFFSRKQPTTTHPVDGGGGGGGGGGAGGGVKGNKKKTVVVGKKDKVENPLVVDGTNVAEAEKTEEQPTKEQVINGTTTEIETGGEGQDGGEGGHDADDAESEEDEEDEEEKARNLLYSINLDWTHETNISTTVLKTIKETPVSCVVAQVTILCCLAFLSVFLIFLSLFLCSRASAQSYWCLCL